MSGLELQLKYSRLSMVLLVLFGPTWLNEMFIAIAHSIAEKRSAR